MIVVEINTLHGLCVPEGRIDDTVNSLVLQLQEGFDITPIGQHELVQGIRLAVKQGRLKDVRFRFHEFIIPVLPDGQLMVWPWPGFPGDQMDSYLSSLI